MMKSKHSVWATLSAIGLAGCLWGTYSLGDSDVIVEGTEGGFYGYSIARYTGDKDFYGDLAVGAPLEDTVYIYVDASKHIDDGELSLDEAVTFTGERYGEAGWSLASGEIADSLWFKDLVIGAPGEEGGRGRIYVLSGGTLNGDIDAEGYATFVGVSSGEYAGWSVAVGDINGDTEDDVLIGACGASGFTGRVYAVYGPVEPGEHDLADADVIINGAKSGGAFGCSLASADLDNDGQDEIIVGEQYGSHRDRNGEGAAWILYDTKAGTQDVADIDDAARISGEVHSGQLGFALSAGGDVNGDGIEDLAIGAPGFYCRFVEETNQGGCDSDVMGTAYVLLGTDGARLDGANNIEDVYDARRVEEDEVAFGYSISLNGDVDGDGYDDILVGNQGDHKASLFYGAHVIGDDSIADGSASAAHALFKSPDADHAGYKVFMDSWDLNADGADEMFIRERRSFGLCPHTLSLRLFRRALHNPDRYWLLRYQRIAARCGPTISRPP